jgi:hypothetical protein
MRRMSVVLSSCLPLALALAAAVSVVHDGYVLNKCLTRLPLGGLAASKALRTSLEMRGTRIMPRGGLKRTANKVRPGGGAARRVHGCLPHGAAHAWHVAGVRARGPLSRACRC